MVLQPLERTVWLSLQNRMKLSCDSVTCLLFVCFLLLWWLILNLQETNFWTLAARDFHTRFAEVGRPTLSVDGTIPRDAGHGLNKKDSSPLPPGCDQLFQALAVMTDWTRQL